MGMPNAAGVTSAMMEHEKALVRAPVSVFDLPLDLRAEAGCDAIAFAALDLPAELMAVERSGGNGGPHLVHQFTLFSLRALLNIKKDANGVEKYETAQKLSIADASAEGWYAHVDPRVRHLCVNAYNEIHQTDAEVTEVFRKSRKLVVL